MTGGHYDPTLACGPASGNPHCKDAGCSFSYSCNFAADPYSCEVGDLSGKYGTLPVSNQKVSWSSPVSQWNFLDSLGALNGKSIVFHCQGACLLGCLVCGTCCCVIVHGVEHTYVCVCTRTQWCLVIASRPHPRIRCVCWVGGTRAFCAKLKPTAAKAGRALRSSLFWTVSCVRACVCMRFLCEMWGSCIAPVAIATGSGSVATWAQAAVYGAPTLLMHRFVLLLFVFCVDVSVTVLDIFFACYIYFVEREGTDEASPRLVF